MKRLRPGWAAFAALGLLAIMAVAPMTVAPRADASPAKINGSGSSYAALAFQQWVADAQVGGLSVNYLPTGSPAGLTQFSQDLIDFAGTEAEYSALGGTPARRGYQYVPDVAGAVAIMYNAQDKAGRKVDYLHLSRQTVARIFIGDIARWSDPAITADNKGLLLPDQPITVVYRGGQSGTTALFYDFVQHTEPDLFAAWAAKHQLPTQVRIIQLDSAPDFAPRTHALNGSDQIAQSVGSPNGLWEIAYDEFGYAKTYNAQAAWIQNVSGAYVQPYAQNISAALESAKLRADLSQELSGVYASANPAAYPISAYSYMVTQCAQASDRPTCAGPYTNPGVTETLTKWMRYIACEGQVNMARIGYSPLPPNLSQEMANSIGRLQGVAPEQLTGGNCANPRFSGSLGQGSG
ncbi:MAG: substrate-binding domain-containing protein, partial [Actinomycetota bacterium]|nr:substrate-binding domain-containing protein [Actinomycetota bacterium]